MRKAHLTFEFENRQQTALDVWLSVPPCLPAQKQIELTWTHRQPDCVNNVAMNTIAFATLKPQEKIGFKAVVELTELGDPTDQNAGPLSAEERTWYLRSSNLIQINPEVRQLAEQIVAGASDEETQAQKIYLSLIQNYTYKWPPPDRGSEITRLTQAGDCGEYSHVFAALCRSLGLPCRVLYGTWALGQSEGHAWNEVYLSKSGWVVVDTSGDQGSFTGQLVKRSLLPASFLLKRWGQPRPDRIAFSIDPDVALAPSYLPVSYVAGDLTESEQLRIAGRQFAWGLESMDGCAPYLQPIYIRQHRFEKWAKDQEPLGHWQVTTAPAQVQPKIAVREWVALLIAIGLVLASAVFGFSRWLGIAGAGLIGLVLLTGSSQARMIARVCLVASVVVGLAQRLLS
ncbi:MAG: transglutaminase domain-containing protein [Anaerolineae bacterium]|nr:transglutaminase domain-containing protein [Anaerolineae bacterium]